MENKTKKKGLLDRITSSRVFRVMFSRKIIVVCAILLLIMVLIAIFAPVIAPYDPNKDDLYNVLKGCSAEHWLGTDSNGRDVLSRIIYGARISFTVGIVAVVISSVIGMALGLIAGMAGGVVDAFIMRVMDGHDGRAHADPGYVSGCDPGSGPGQCLPGHRHLDGARATPVSPAVRC